MNEMKGERNVDHRKVGSQGASNSDGIRARKFEGTIPNRRDSDKGSLRQKRIDGMQKVLLRFIECYEKHLLTRCAGVGQSGDWILDFPEKFVSEIEYIDQLDQIR